MKKLFLISIVALGMLTACSPVNDPLEDFVPETQKPDPEKENPQQGGGEVQSRGAVPITLTSQQKQINNGLSLFSWKLFNESYKIRENGTNILISPISLEVALGMFANGLSADEQSQVLKTLGLENYSMEEVNTYFQTMMEGLANADDVAELHMANSFWYRSTHKVKEAYAKVLNDSYKAESYAVDFSLQSTINSINAWCAKQTNDRIKSILDDGVDAAIYAVLLNAVYFKSTWKYEFDTEQTHKQVFHFADGKDAEVDMMSQGDMKVDYLAPGEFRIVAFPFVNEAYKFFIILPDEKVSIDKVAATVQFIHFTMMQPTTLDRFAMPKFEVSYKEEKLAAAMQQINPSLGFGGLRFQPLEPEILSETKNDILQKTFFKVDEKGAEAAAVTGIIVKNTSVNPSKNFIADRPFLYGIMETSTSCPLFIGYYGEH